MKIYKAYHRNNGQVYENLFTSYDAAKMFILASVVNDNKNPFGIIVMHQVGEEFQELKSYDYYPQLDGRTHTPSEYFNKFDQFNN